ncbi:hypothetical protein O181_051053 [Austropuccinia psidii MF-1]|uniref:Calcineurin-like phosphoesterase domain-containing protein n=1 Tax=Austropuccinia psidii MF-1 TaxID=1389203 RepID=A0A9Q3E087_9BASI|nr:hypothetical protein [Austropuccinia psidii MF-1]
MLRVIHRYRKPLMLVLLLIFVVKYFRKSKYSPDASQIAYLSPFKTNHDKSKPDHTRFESRIVAVGDLHGDLNHALRVLRLAGVIDSSNQWAGKKTVLVQTGDIVDRGKDTILLYELMDQLRTQARSAGGAVVSLLGNHEYMNALGDWRYVTKEDISTFGGTENRRKIISTNGWIGKTWIANYSVAARVPHPLGFPHLSHIASNFTSFQPSKEPSNDPFLSTATAFVHGGITPEYAALGISEINQIGASFLYRALDGKLPYRHLPPDTPSKEAQFYAEHGPLWERTYALDDEDVVCDTIDRATKLLNVKRLVMGHTPQFEGITSRCGSKILLIDTGISSAYGGPLTAIEIEYSQTLIGQNKFNTTWSENEAVNALEEGKPKTLLFHSERVVNLTYS